MLKNQLYPPMTKSFDRHWCRHFHVMLVILISNIDTLFYVIANYVYRLIFLNIG